MLGEFASQFLAHGGWNRRIVQQAAQLAARSVGAAAPASAAVPAGLRRENQPVTEDFQPTSIRVRRPPRHRIIRESSAVDAAASGLGVSTRWALTGTSLPITAVSAQSPLPTPKSRRLSVVLTSSVAPEAPVRSGRPG